MRKQLLFAATILLIFVTTTALAQEGLSRGTNQLGFWAGYSPNSPRNIGVTPDTKLFLFEAQYSRVLFRTSDVAWKYVGEMVPAAVISLPAQQVYTTNGLVSQPAKTVYGAGFNPLGAQWNFRSSKKVQPFVNAHGGLLYFAEQVPIVQSSQFNFTFSFGAGVEILSRNNKSLTLGYKYHHISNDETGHFNPGVDSNLFYVGYSWMWKKR
jgi:hypothetical protein